MAFSVGESTWVGPFATICALFVVGCIAWVIWRARQHRQKQEWVHDTRKSLLDIYYRALDDAQELLPVAENEPEAPTRQPVLRRVTHVDTDVDWAHAPLRFPIVLDGTNNSSADIQVTTIDAPGLAPAVVIQLPRRTRLAR